MLHRCKLYRLIASSHVTSYSTERAEQAALMVRPRRLSDSSVSSVCSDNDASFINPTTMSTSVLQHGRTPNVCFLFQAFEKSTKFQDRLESHGYICPRSGSSASNTGVSQNNNKNSRLEQQGYGGGSLRISSTSNSANNGKSFS